MVGDGVGNVGDDLHVVVGDGVLCDIVVDDSEAYGSVVSGSVVSGSVVSGSVVNGVMNGEIGGMVTSVSSSSVNQIIENMLHTNCNNYICKIMRGVLGCKMLGC